METLMVLENVPGNCENRLYRQGGVHYSLTVLTVFSAVRSGSALGGSVREQYAGGKASLACPPRTAWKQG